jgi:hypothetical protein
MKRLRPGQIFAGIAVFIAVLILFWLTSCSATTSAVDSSSIDESVEHVHYAPNYEENNQKFWAGAPTFEDGTTSRACFDAQIASYYIYDPQVGTWMAFVCPLVSGYGIVSLAPDAPFSIETVTEYDAYLKGKGYGQ